jgi:cytosine/adenosine deaminase-related metal-dependent hydrolase
LLSPPLGHDAILGRMNDMTKTTWIKSAEWVVAWDRAAERHVYLKDVDLVITGDRITFIGNGYRGSADEEIDGKERCVMPGLVDVHTHPSSEPAYRGIREEHGVPQMHMSGLYERVLAFWPDAEGRIAAAEVAYCEMLLSGVTTVADLSAVYPGWVELAARSGIRVYLAPAFASARWRLANEWELGYSWDEQTGRRRFEEALGLIDGISRHPCGRLGGIVYPAQIDTCTADLLCDGVAAAKERSIPFTTHCAQSVAEFNEMVRRHGKTPIQWARTLGILGPNTILGHALFTDEHSWIRWHTREDLKVLADTRTSIAHCPTPFARYGAVLEDFGRYRRAGINLALGTDTAPHNLLEEMRRAAVLARVAAKDITAVSTADLFHAATVGGANALGRDDIGRLAPGMKADLVLIDLKNAYMMPARDPLRSLVYTACDRAVRDVYVDGAKVVDDRRVVTLDHAVALEALGEAQRRMERLVPERDYRRRSAEAIAPLSLPVIDPATISM